MCCSVVAPQLSHSSQTFFLWAQIWQWKRNRNLQPGFTQFLLHLYMRDVENVIITAHSAHSPPAAKWCKWLSRDTECLKDRLSCALTVHLKAESGLYVNKEENELGFPTAKDQCSLKILNARLVLKMHLQPFSKSQPSFRAAVLAGVKWSRTGFLPSHLNR